MLEDLKPIGLGDFISLIKSVNISHWGNEITLECVYDPEDRLPYRLIFQNCQNIEWEVHSPEDAKDIEADLMDLQLDEKNAKKRAIIYTDIFSIIVEYEEFKYEKTW